MTTKFNVTVPSTPKTRHYSRKPRNKLRISRVNSSFSPDNLVFLDSNKSASIKTTTTIFNRFVSLLRQLYSNEADRCPQHHRNLFYEFKALFKSSDSEPEWEDLKHIKVWTRFPVGKSTENLATVTAYPSTNNIHVQGSVDNLLSYIESHLSHLMKISSTANLNDIKNIKCLHCYITSQTIPHDISSASHAADSTPAFDSSSVSIASITPDRNAIHSLPTQLLDRTPLSSPATTPPSDTPISQIKLPSIAPQIENSNLMFFSPSQRLTSTPNLLNLNSPSISTRRETTMISQVLLRVDKIEDLVAGNNVITSGHDNQANHVMASMKDLSDRVAALESHPKGHPPQHDQLTKLQEKYTTLSTEHSKLVIRVLSLETDKELLLAKLVQLADVVEQPTEQAIVAPPPPLLPPPPPFSDLEQTVSQLAGAVTHSYDDRVEVSLDSPPSPPAPVPAPRNTSPIDIPPPVLYLRPSKKHSIQPPATDAQPAISGSDVMSAQLNEYRVVMNARYLKSRTNPATTVPKLMDQTPVIHDVFVGDSNLMRCRTFIQNRAPNVLFKADSGATFFSMLAEVNKLSHCKTLYLQGGSTDAVQHNVIKDAISDLNNLICAAKCKSERVILVPPPPTCDVMLAMEGMMAEAAMYHGVGFIPIHKIFSKHKKGPYLFRDQLHPTRLGSGLYGLAIVDYLSSHTSAVSNRNGTSCIYCHHAGHGISFCPEYGQRSTQTTSGSYTPFQLPNMQYPPPGYHSR